MYIHLTVNYLFFLTISVNVFFVLLFDDLMLYLSASYICTQGTTYISDTNQLGHVLNENQIDVVFITETLLRLNNASKILKYRVYKK